jgi:hypothetical protein
VVSSFEEAGEELFTFLQFPQSQWKVLRLTNARAHQRGISPPHQKPSHHYPDEHAVLLLELMCYKIRKAKGRVPLVDLRRDVDLPTTAELFKGFDEANNRERRRRSRYAVRRSHFAVRAP